MGWVDHNGFFIESHWPDNFVLCTFYNRKLVLPMQSILRERGDRAARRIFSKPPAACALPNYNHCCTAVQPCCTAVLTIPVVDISNLFAYVCNLKIRTRKLGYGTVCNQEEHWNELTCDLLISCSFASLCSHNKQSRAEQSPQGRMSTMILCFRWDLHWPGEMVRNTKISGQNVRIGGPCTHAWHEAWVST